MTAPLRAQIEGKALVEHVLCYGASRTPMARVVPDAVWPGMWRIVWEDGTQSDMLNLPRARDAAAVVCERGPPTRDRRLFHWKKNASKPGALSPPMR